MADSDKPLPSVREHMETLRDGLIKDGKIAPDAESAGKAALLPTFSTNTATLDENTGKPIVPPVPVPDATKTLSADDLIDRTVSSESREAAAPENVAPGGAPPSPGAAATQAAETAAQAMADDLAEFEWEDPDNGLKIPIRTRKEFLDVVKRGYGRRAAHDRALSYLKNAEPVLREMIESGRVNQILPLLQRAMQDPAYAEYVWQGFQRAQSGLPLIEQAAREAAAAGAPPEQAVNAEIDPYYAERIAPIQTQLQSVTKTLEQYEQERRSQAEAREQEARVAQWQEQQLAAAHRDLAQYYPGDYTGDLNRDRGRWAQVIDYAKQAGYIEAYGLRGAIVFAGQAIHQIEQERLAATASPTATALGQLEAKQMDLARQQAAAAAQTVSGGAPSTISTPAPVKPSPKRPDGTLKPVDEFMAENLAWLQRSRATA